MSETTQHAHSQEVTLTTKGMTLFEDVAFDGVWVHSFGTKEREKETFRAVFERSELVCD